jgi:N6-adenosine-specific RNA methylase IME4
MTKGFRWRQDEAPADYLLDKLTAAGALVVDPFAGYGTYGLATTNRRRQFIGVEADAGRFAKAVAALNSHGASAKARAEGGAMNRSGRVHDGATPPLPSGPYTTIVADPPWPYRNRASRGAAENHYRTMTLEEICELRVVNIAADDSCLYLCTTSSFLREAFVVMEAWGFSYKVELAWVKPQMGMGNYFRGAHEPVLFGVRGKLKLLRNDIASWHFAPRTRHSEKPDSFFDMIERASPGPYLELFARRQRPGWEVWGNEVSARPITASPSLSTGSAKARVTKARRT